jgi:hypothetical protein
MKDWTMSNPVVLITGALTGIGRATAIAFAKARSGSDLTSRSFLSRVFVAFSAAILPGKFVEDDGLRMLRYASAVPRIGSISPRSSATVMR